MHDQGGEVGARLDDGLFGAGVGHAAEGEVGDDFVGPGGRENDQG